MVLDILKDFAMVDRREYVPYCPICATSFAVSSEIRLFPCSHFLCVGCFERLTIRKCPFCQQEGEVRSGEFLGDAVSFLATWTEEVARGVSKELVVDRLIEEILLVRKNLSCKILPCRVQAEGRICSKLFNCPYDHTFQLYRKQLCPIPRCPHGERCLYIHSGGNTGGALQPKGAASKKGGSGKKGGAKKAGADACCRLS
jgi:hypothetical protein